MRNDKLRLLDILEAIEKIELKIKAGKEEFLQNETIHDSVLYNFIVIGEAAANLSLEVKEKDPTIPWTDIIGLRNIIAHHYFDIAEDIIWDTIILDLANFKSKISKIIETLNNDL